jgi:hypothetical protein
MRGVPLTEREDVAKPRSSVLSSPLPATRGAYAKAPMALRLPMSGGFESFSNVRDISVHLPAFVEDARGSLQAAEDSGRQANHPRVLRRLRAAGCRHRPVSKFKKYSVISTANVSLSRARKDTPLVEKKGPYVSINEEGMYDAGVRYEDLVLAAEAVVTKPGYGI